MDVEALVCKLAGAQRVTKKGGILWLLLHRSKIYTQIILYIPKYGYYFAFSIQIG